jgi:hypothetical protein
MVSIMPGMEARAPERTESSSGSAGSPKRFTHFRFEKSNALFHLLLDEFSDIFAAFLVYSVQASVVMVKPGGTTMPSRHISAKLAPLPPSRFFMEASPSVLEEPKQYKYLIGVDITGIIT